MIRFEIPKNVPAWVENCLQSRRNILATSNQGTVLLFRQAGMEFVVKTPMGKGAVRRARLATLLREHEAYRRLEGVEGIPRCYGLVGQRYLVLEFIHGTPYREAVIEDREAWFACLLQTIEECHRRGVAHGDLKSKSNPLVRDDGRPCVLDFGTTVLRGEGFHPIRNRMFRYAAQLDFNAWVKHKYEGRYEDALAEDRARLNYSLIERWLRGRRQRRKRREAD